MTDCTIAIPIEMTPGKVLRYYYDLTKSSTQWERAIKNMVNTDRYSAMHFLGPTGLPIISSVYVVYVSRNQKRKGDRLLRESGLGQFSAEDPLKLGPQVTLFMRPHDDWQVEMPARGRA